MPPAPQLEEEIFQAARRIESAEERLVYLDRACGDDAELRSRVEALLAAHESSREFLESPAEELPGERATAHFPVTERPGDRLGPYQLLQQIGEGGMGVVYMAEQTEPIERRVAVKIIRPGMDTRQVIARFEAERQALALMDHPNIAKVLDAGTTDTGRPYFVMELFKGAPITEYADEHQLTPRQRLELFLPICHAVQHAHQKGIIHRDIKPSNVLVAHYDDHPVPKIIDFGVAKAINHRLTEKTMFTEFGQVVGTFEYMSPEQARLNQWDVDTRSDIYSLGVLLYELLAGETPFDRQRLRSAAFDEVLRIIREEDPPRPSLRLSGSDTLPSIAAKRRIEPTRLSTLVRGELDWIVMKALEKDRNRRYDSANGLRRDVQRYLEGDPVTAAPPSPSYRLRKFAKRHRVGVIVSLLLTCALLLAIAGTSIGMARAFIERQRADKQAQSAKAARKKAESANEESRYWQYISSIPAANSFRNEHATGTARSMLKNAPAEHRNFEWALLANRAWPHFPGVANSRRLSRTEGSSVGQFWKTGTAKVVQEMFPSSPTGGLYDGSFSPDGKSVFFNLTNGVVKEFSVDSGKWQASYSSDTGNSMDVTLSPDGTKLAGFTFSNRASVWDVASTRVIAMNSNDLQRSSPWLCRWSPDQKYLVTGHMDGTLRLWNALSLVMESEWSGHDSDTTDVFIPSSSDVVWSASNDGTVQQRSFPDGRLLGEYHIPLDGELEYQAISPTGRLAFAILRDGSHLLWEIETEKIVSQLSGPDPDPYLDEPRIACSFSADESCIAVMTGKLGVTIYDVASGKALTEISGNGVPLRAVHFSPDGKMALTASFDGRARIWSCLPEEQVRLSNAHEGAVYQIDVDSSGERLLAGSFDSNASVWNLRNDRRRVVYTSHKAEIVAADLHPDGTLAATLDADGVIHVWDAESGTRVFEIDPESDAFSDHIHKSGKLVNANLLNFSAPLSTGIFTPDGSRIVAFHKDGMKVFNARNGEVETVLEGASFAAWPVYSHDSSLVAILEMNAKNAGVWDIRTGKLLHRRLGHRECLVMMDFSPVDQRIVTGALESSVVIWDGRSGEKIGVLEAQSGNVMSCHFSSDGKYVLAGSADSTARIWDSRTGQLVTTLAGHNNRVRDVRLSPDQTRLVSWGMDDRAIIWDFARPYANQLLVLGGDSKLLQARWSPDGRDIITAWSDGTVEVWRGASRKDIAHLADEGGSFEDAFGQWQMQYTNTLAE